MTNIYEIETRTAIMLENNFRYHSPINDQNERYVHLRMKARELAYELVQNTPPSREQSLALTNLEQAIFWANAAIARNEKPQDNNVDTADTGDK